MSDCLFCKIVDKKINADIVYEDDRAIAFRDLKPTAPTHVLVIPRAHIESLDDVQAEHEADIGHLFRVASQVAARDGLSRGYRTVFNCGPDAGQSVFHIHLHLVGGRAMGWPPFP
jgi:histidine triad (HIT) family protein